MGQLGSSYLHDDALHSVSLCIDHISWLANSSSTRLSFKFKPNQYSKEIGVKTASASVAFFFLYMLIFGATANCVPWVYVPEILPLHARAKGTAIGISSNWLWVSAVFAYSKPHINHS